VLEQALPRGQSRHRDTRAHREVNVARQRRKVACLDDDILRERAIASPVREAFCDGQAPLIVSEMCSRRPP
jgi:hypothetical protein